MATKEPFSRSGVCHNHKIITPDMSDKVIGIAIYTHNTLADVTN